MHPCRLCLDDIAVTAEVAKGQSQDTADNGQRFGGQRVTQALDNNRIGKGHNECQPEKHQLDGDAREREDVRQRRKRILRGGQVQHGEATAGDD